MNEKQAFLAMLERAGIGHGIRHDYNPPGTAVQVEHEDANLTTTDWLFDVDGKLVGVIVVEKD